jgi:heme/copper-type cytochrome/quinol oxidase subunit 3
MRKFLLAIALLLGFIFVIARLTEIQNIAEGDLVVPGLGSHHRVLMDN